MRAHRYWLVMHRGSEHLSYKIQLHRKEVQGANVREVIKILTG